jgi:hypothetical protein
MKKKSAYPILLLIALCVTGIRVHAQDFGTELPPCTICGDPCDADPCSCSPACTVPPPPPTVPPLPINPPPPPDPPPPPPLPTGPSPCVANPCSCNPQSCGIPPPPTCQQDPCICFPGQCTPGSGASPNPPAPHATVTVTPALTSAGSTVEYVQATAPTGTIFSWGSLGIVFGINPQTNTLNAASGGGTAANPWYVTSWVAGSGTTYTQVQVINSNAPGVIAFTIICQLTPNGSSVPNTQSINVQYTFSTNSCIITEN